MLQRRAFTLIELLIVVAIIAILAAIAIPNFLEAQTRAKVSRVRADHRSIATALESYRVDYNMYPDWYQVTGFDFVSETYTEPPVLSTPTAYITSYASIFGDPFRPQLSASWWDSGLYLYHSKSMIVNINRGLYGGSSDWEPTEWFMEIFGIAGARETHWWILGSSGPDRILWVDAAMQIPYDTTNGTASEGDIVRFGP